MYAIWRWDTQWHKCNLNYTCICNWYYLNGNKNNDTWSIKDNVFCLILLHMDYSSEDTVHRRMKYWKETKQLNSADYLIDDCFSNKGYLPFYPASNKYVTQDEKQEYNLRNKGDLVVQSNLRAVFEAVGECDSGKRFPPTFSSLTLVRVQGECCWQTPRIAAQRSSCVLKRVKELGKPQGSEHAV